MGTFLNEKTWAKSAGNLIDPKKALNKHRLDISITSCDESESKLVQRIDDDKIEIMCHQRLTDYMNFEIGRLGQVRSPF